MAVFDSVLTARAHAAGHAVRRRGLRHQILDPDAAFGLVGFTQGGEPFLVAAAGYGTSPDDLSMAVAGQPRNRDLMMAALAPLAEVFCDWFEAPWESAGRDLQHFAAVYDGTPELVRRTCPTGTVRTLSVPGLRQLILPTGAALSYWRGIARRLAFLPTDPAETATPAPGVVVRFGRHLRFLVDHHLARGEGQQLCITLGTLLSSGWATVQTDLERANLPALWGWVRPDGHADGPSAAAELEAMKVGPLPATWWENEHLAGRQDAFDAASRDLRASPAGAAHRSALARRNEAHGDLIRLYRELVEPAWDLLWTVLAEESGWPDDQRFLPDRAARDLVAYGKHMDFMDNPTYQGRRRAVPAFHTAANALSEAEDDQQVLGAQIAATDPLVQAALACDNRALIGTVVQVDRNHRMIKPGKQRSSAAPLVVVRADHPYRPGREVELWWAERPDKTMFQVDSVTTSGGSTLVRLVAIKGSSAASPLPGRGDRFVATDCSTASSRFQRTWLSQSVPTMFKPTGPAGWDSDHIEEDDEVPTAEGGDA